MPVEANEDRGPNWSAQARHEQQSVRKWRIHKEMADTLDTETLVATFTQNSNVQCSLPHAEPESCFRT